MVLGGEALEVGESGDRAKIVRSIRLLEVRRRDGSI
jgi:hypothetical protein